MNTIGKAVELSAQTTRNVFKRNLTRFGAVLLSALSSLVAVPHAAVADAPQHRDQAPGFYRLKVGDLEVTALFDGPGVFDLNWVNGQKTKDGVLKALQDDPHLLDVADTGYLVNTGKQLILVDAGSGTWFGGGRFGHLVANLRSAGYTPEEVDIVLVTHLHSDHIGGLTTRDGKRVFPNAEIYVAKSESDFWLSRETAAKAPKEVQPFFESAQAIAAPYIKAGKWHTFNGSEPIVDGMQLVPLSGHTPGHTSFAIASGNSTILIQSDVTNIPEFFLRNPDWHVAYDTDPDLAQKTRHKFYDMAAAEKATVVGFHFTFPSIGHVEKDGAKYRLVPIAWNPVI